VELIRKNAAQSQKMFEENCKAGLDMLHKSSDFVGSGVDRGDELFGNARELWQTTLEAMTTSTQAVADNCTKAVEQWSACFGRTCTAAAQAAPAKAK